jgi:antitoxin FitA
VPVNISVKNVPDEIIERLRKRASLHHRSMQGELMVILEEATSPARLRVEQADIQLRSLGLTTGDESVSWVRELRDGR